MPKVPLLMKMEEMVTTQIIKGWEKNKISIYCKWGSFRQEVESSYIQREKINIDVDKKYVGLKVKEIWELTSDKF